VTTAAVRAPLLRRTAIASAAPVTPAGLARKMGIRPRFCRAVDRLLRDTSPQFLVDHCRRSFRLAMLIAAASGAEVVYAGVMLHDLGLTVRYHSTAVRFEVASANAARAFVRRHGMSAERAKKVWDVAALHCTGGIAHAKSPETAVGAAAIDADVTGHKHPQPELKAQTPASAGASRKVPTP
jgi:hypothetical protein